MLENTAKPIKSSKSISQTTKKTKKQSKIEKKAVHKQTDEGRLQYAMQWQYKQKMGTDAVNIYVWLICKPIEP